LGAREERIRANAGFSSWPTAAEPSGVWISVAHSLWQARIRAHLSDGHYRDVVVIRRYGPVYPGYGYYRSDDDAYRWLAFTAITLKILDNLNEAQERAHEQAQAEAATAPVGDTIYWNQSGASGAVSVLRDGYSASGRYCREFQQEVTIGGGTERAYGTACQQADGSWQVVSTDE
jgi:17 kDa outer membrane surface antigen